MCFSHPRYHAEQDLRRVETEIAFDATQPLPSYKSAWQAFVARQRKLGRTITAAMSEEFSRLLPSERDRYEPHGEFGVKDLSQVQKAVVTESSRGDAVVADTPLEIGSQLHPIAEEHLRDMPSKIAENSEKWQSFVGELIQAENDGDDGEKERAQCWEVYGPGFCKDELTPEAVSRIDRYRNMLYQVSRVETKIFEGCPVFPLLHVRKDADAAASSSDRPDAGRLFMFTTFSHNPRIVIGFECSGHVGALQSGDIVTVGHTLSSVVEHSTLATELHNAYGASNTFSFLLQYSWVSLQTVLVESVEDVTKKLSEKSKREIEDDEVAIVKAMMKESKTRYKQSTSGSKKKSSSSGGAGCGKKPKKVIDDLGDADASSDSSLSSEIGTAADVMAYWAAKEDEKEEEMELLALAATTDDMLQLPKVVRIDSPSLAVPFKYEFRHWATNAKMGTQSYVKQGMPSESVSVYCNMHACKCPMKLTAKSPSQNQLVQWFKDGDDLPKGKDGREAHLRAYRELCVVIAASTAA
jgi:hypothetical protein